MWHKKKKNRTVRFIVLIYLAFAILLCSFGSYAAIKGQSAAQDPPAEKVERDTGIRSSQSGGSEAEFPHTQGGTGIAGSHSPREYLGDTEDDFWDEDEDNASQDPQEETGESGPHGSQGGQGEKPGSQEGEEDIEPGFDNGGAGPGIGNGNGNGDGEPQGDGGAQGLPDDFGDYGDSGPRDEDRGETGMPGFQGGNGDNGSQGFQGNKQDEVSHENEKCKVIFKANGGTMPEGAPYNITVSWGDVLELPTPTRTNYTFVGWYTGAKGGYKITKTTRIKSDYVLYAHWEKNPQYTVSFVTNCDMLIADIVYFAGEEIFDLPTLEREDYFFLGWYYDEEFHDIIQYPFTLSKDITAYAYWMTAYYTVNFHTNFGAEIEGFEAVAGTQFEGFSTPAYEGYAFKGWFYDRKFTQAVTFPLELHANLEIYGYWEYIAPAANEKKVAKSTSDVVEISAPILDIRELEGEKTERESNPLIEILSGNGHTMSEFHGHISDSIGSSNHAESGTAARVWKWENTWLTDSHKLQDCLPEFEIKVWLQKKKWQEE